MDSTQNKGKKALIAVTKAAPFGGAQHYVLDIARGAKDAGFEVVVVCGGEGEFIDRLGAIGIRVVGVPIENKASFGAILAAKRLLREVFQAEKPDIVHLNSSLVGIAGAWAAQQLRIPKIIFTDHGWAFKEARSFPVRLMIWLISWTTVLLVDCVIAVSDSELTLTMRMPFARGKAIRIYNGIDMHMQFGSGDVIRRAFPADAKITGTVGELNKNKNHIALIEQARTTADMYVAIVGEGELRPFLEQKIKEYGLGERVRLFGFMPASEVMKGFDVFALPSLKESLGYVILEARAAGLPIIPSSVGGIPEAIKKPLSEFSKEAMVQQTLALYTS